MEKTKVYYLETPQDILYFEKFYLLAQYLHKDSNELWASYMEGDEPDIHTKTIYTDFTINEGENFSGNRRRYFEDLVQHELPRYYDWTMEPSDYFEETPSASFVSHLIKTAFGLNNRVEYIGDYIFIVLPKMFCSIVTKVSDYDRNSGDIGYYYMKKCFDCVIKSIKNSKKYTSIQSKIFYEFEPWEYIDVNGYFIKVPWYKHYSSTLEKDRLK